MNRHRPALVLALLALAAAPVLAACSGSSANVGDDTDPVDNTPAAGGSSNGGPGSGGSATGGGATTSGGATSSGGAVTAPVTCGSSTCAAGEFCCNESCGICAPEGGGCTKQVCGGPGPEPVECGTALCAAGLECCNPSCGICVPPGGACTQQICEPNPGGACQTDAECFLVDDYCQGCNCRALTAADTLPRCETELFQCFQAPCNGQHAACVNGACAVVAD